MLVSVSCRREKVLVLDYLMRAVLRLVEMEEWNWVLMTFEGMRDEAFVLLIYHVVWVVIG